jgi:DNA-binding MarR family transcriptional regulator
MSVSIRIPAPDRALTQAQKHALLALRGGAELELATIVERTDMRPNSAALALRGLERRGFVRRQQGERETWTLTFGGHGLAQRLAAR